MAHRLSAGVLVPSALGTLLRLYEVFLDGVEAWRGATPLWSVLPYAVALGMALRPQLQMPAAGFASACFVADLYAHYALFLGPGTDSLFVLFMPLWNLLIIGPAGALAGWLYGRWQSDRRS
jgi:hypothetical protein